MITFPAVEDLLDDMKARVTDPEKQLILASLAADTVRVGALAMTDPVAAERETRFIRASLSNLTAAEAVSVQTAVTQWLSQLAFALVQAAFTA